MMPETAFYEGCFSRCSAGFRGGRKVYTEDVGSSSLSSPTIFQSLRCNLRSALRHIEPWARSEVEAMNHIERRASRTLIIAAVIVGGYAIGEWLWKML